MILLKVREVVKQFFPDHYCYLLQNITFPCPFQACSPPDVFALFIRLQGIGLLLSDDNTRYEGEFTGNCHLAGKV